MIVITSMEVKFSIYEVRHPITGKKGEKNPNSLPNYPIVPTQKHISFMIVIEGFSEVF